LESALNEYFRSGSIDRVVEEACGEVEPDVLISDLIKASKEAADQELGDNYQNDEISPYYDDGDYVITKCLDFDFFISKSPYYTLAQFCSPCVPGAGNLDNFCPDGVKTFCLGHEWFEDDKAPYPVYSITTNQIIECSTTTHT
jgi:hypothetical protein